jgi:hypothetical protein
MLDKNPALYCSAVARIRINAAVASIGPSV